MSRTKRSDYIAFERDQIPSGAMVAVCRTGQEPAAWVEAELVNVFRQTRGDGAHEGLDDLIRSLNVDGEVSLIQPPTIGLFSLQSAKRYISDLNACWKSDLSYSDCNLLPGSNRFSMAAIIAGHRRTLASIAVARTLTGSDMPNLWIPVQPQINPSFFDGLRTQFQENSHKRVPLWEEADSISAVVRWGRGNGTLPTYADAAVYLGITTERISNAVSFFALPETIKERVRRGSLTQESAIHLERIGAAKAVRLLEGKVEEDTHIKMIKKLYHRQLRVDELRPYLDEYGLVDEWEATLDTELTRLLANDKKSSYVGSRVSEILGLDQLINMDGGVDTRDSRVNGLLADRRRLQPEALRSLRTLLAALGADAQRLRFAIDNPDRNDSSLLSTPIITNSPHSRKTWQSIVEQMEVVISLDSSDSQIITALDAVIGNLTVLASETSLENLVQDRAKDWINVLNTLKNMVGVDGASLSGTGFELSLAIEVLEGAIRSTIQNERPGGLF
jgi:hypothetical protein